MKQSIVKSLTNVVLVAMMATPALAAEEPKHFSPKGKPPSKYTIEAQQKVRDTFPFADKQDFTEAE